ncbi:DUF5011 domain-containing protein [bacterium]|nr:DUF5011 domain-containing protein [bacterium]
MNILSTLMRGTVALAMFAMLFAASFFLPSLAYADGDHKVTICHKTHSEGNPSVTITIDEHALDSHVANHGDGEYDTEGPCEETADDEEDDNDEDDSDEDDSDEDDSDDSPPPVPSVLTGPSCGFAEQDGRTIFNFPSDKKLRSDSHEDDARTNPLPFTLTPGTYDVTLVSYDGYADRVNISQPRESWVALLHSADNSTTLAETNASNDLADYVLEASSVTLVNEDFVVPAGVVSIKAYHDAYPDTNSPNSVFPVCAVFDRTDTATPPPATNTPPVITVLGDNPFTITAGNNFTDPGATSTDAEDGDLTSEIVVSGAAVASTTAVGSYVIVYSVTDSGGLSASTTRTVIVAATTTPPTSSTPTPTPSGGGGGTGGGGTPPQCLDFIDNDGDGKIDAKDPGCHSDGNPDNTSTYQPFDNDETDTPSGSGSPSTGSVSSSGGTGSSTGSQCSYLNEFIKRGANNNPVEVMKLQSFLKIFEGANVTVSGFYDDASYNAVLRFQEKYFGDILAPWGHDRGTGFVYLTTRKKVNEIYCKHPFPLTAVQQAEVLAFNTYLQSLRHSAEEGFPTSDTSATTEEEINIDDLVGFGETQEGEVGSVGVSDETTPRRPVAFAAAILGGVFANLLQSYWFVLLLILILVFYFILRSFYGHDEGETVALQSDDTYDTSENIDADEYPVSTDTETSIRENMEIPEKPKESNDEFTTALLSGNNRNDHRL